MGLIRTSTAFFALVVLFVNTKATSPDPSCNIDAVLYSTQNDDIYFFKDNMYARWNVKSDRMYYYGQTKDLIDGLKTPIDAAIETNLYGTQQIFFFSGNQVQIYDHFHKSPLNTIDLKDFAVGLPESIDATFFMQSTFYFFKDYHIYFMFVAEKKVHGPFNITNFFPNLKGPVNAAVLNTFHEGRDTAYLFSGQNYYLFAESAEKVIPIEKRWKGLLNSPLFAKCEIDCNTVTISNDDWKFGSISYNMSMNDTYTRSIGIKNFTKYTTDQVQIDYNFSYNEYFSFLQSGGVNVKQNTSFVVTTPDFSNIRDSINITKLPSGDKHYYFSYGIKTEREDTIKDHMLCTSVIGDRRKCTVFLNQYNIQVPYTIVWNHKVKSASCKSHGVTDILIAHIGKINEPATKDMNDRIEL
ncbi:uncharacterized protein [Clytia hemisphaerica]|uniref:Uncharacterized protein n=1 Tax=Clytia hemisphaerica TaxID=252671 RepID=A0A7M5XEF1_9CNID|eukprot:TCONS_00029191-protein